MKWNEKYAIPIKYEIKDYRQNTKERRIKICWWKIGPHFKTFGFFSSEVGGLLCISEVECHLSKTGLERKKENASQTDLIT